MIVVNKIKYFKNVKFDEHVLLNYADTCRISGNLSEILMN